MEPLYGTLHRYIYGDNIQVHINLYGLSYLVYITKYNNGTYHISYDLLDHFAKEMTYEEYLDSHDNLILNRELAVSLLNEEIEKRKDKYDKISREKINNLLGRKIVIINSIFCGSIRLYFTQEPLDDLAPWSISNDNRNTIQEAIRLNKHKDYK